MDDGVISKLLRTDYSFTRFLRKTYSIDEITEHLSFAEKDIDNTGYSLG